jgi:hypothetical protein
MFPGTLRRAAPYGLLALGSLLACSRVLVLDGWPRNHDGAAGFQRVETFRRAFAEGNVLPLWEPRAENGYGSPFPFFYHRLFNTLAGAVALATGSPYTAVKVVVPFLLFAGALGTFRVLSAIGLGRAYATGGALLLAFSNYAYTDWVVRGAFAEFTAFMLVPWLTLAALGVVRGAPRAGWGLGAALTLMFFAHSVLFVFAFPLVLVAFLGAFVLSRERRRVLANMARAALVVLVVAGPFLLGIRLFGDGLAVDRQRSGPFSVFRNFAPLGLYLYDRLAGWTSSTAGYTTEIGRGFNTLAIVSFAAVAAGFARRRLSLGRILETRAAWFLVLGSGLCYFLLQMPVASPLYRALPPLQFLQFPWRLLAYSTLLSILVLCLSLDLLEASRPGPAARLSLRAALLGAVLFQVWYGVGRPPPDRLFSVADIDADLEADPNGATSGFDGAFRPQGISLPPRRPFLEATGCAVESASPVEALAGVVDVPELRLVVEAAPGAELVINQFANPFLAVSGAEGASVGTTAWGAILVRPPTGWSHIVIRRRGLLAALKVKLFGS